MAKTPSWPGIPSVATQADLLPAVAVLVEIVELLIGQRGTDVTRQAATRGYVDSGATAARSYVDGNFAKIEERLRALEP